MEPLHAFRTIEIPIEMNDGAVREIRVPFTLDLMERAEETIIKASERSWWRIRPSDKTVREAFMEFCSLYLPENFDYKNADPTFPALFFSRVRDELNRSIENCMASTKSTDE